LLPYRAPPTWQPGSSLQYKNPTLPSSVQKPTVALFVVGTEMCPQKLTCWISNPHCSNIQRQDPWRQSDHESSDLVCELIHWWIYSLMGYWEAVETFKRWIELGDVGH
jgi:hypothetical protein